MKRYVWVAMFLLVTSVALAQSVPSPERNKGQGQQRSLQGQVMGHQDAALGDAIVYLKNTKTLAVRSYVTKEDGQYQFHALAPNVDYEVFAQLKDKKSDVKTLSAFDSRQKASINLHIDTK